MPRKSAADVKMVSLDGRQNYLRPPASLSDPERSLFASLVAANPASHFKSSDLPLLAQYVQAATLSEQAVAELRVSPVVNGKPSPWLAVFEKCNRAMISLSMRLRLSPQARAPNNPSRPQSQASSSVYDRIRLETETDDGQN
jgi:hypothetical protein